MHMGFIRLGTPSGRMRVRVVVHGLPPPRDRALDLPAGAVADDAARALGVRPGLVLVFRGDRPLPGDAALWEGDELRVLRVVSGGG
jgi:sulfur carrier protein ThiS